MSLIDDTQKTARVTLVWRLLTQKAAHDELVDIMRRRIADLEADIAAVNAGRRAERRVMELFFLDGHPKLIPEFVALAYEEDPQSAKTMVAMFHDETLDLSKIACTGQDFDPWEPETSHKHP